MWAHFLLQDFLLQQSLKNPFLENSNHICLTSTYPHITGKSLISRQQGLWKNPICCVVTKTSAVEPLPIIPFFAACLEGRSCWTESFFSLHTDHTLCGGPASLEEDPRTTNSCCRSRRTRGLQTAHLHFWERSSSSSHERLEDNEGFVLEKYHIHFLKKSKNQTNKQTKYIYFFYWTKAFSWIHLTGAFLGRL